MDFITIAILQQYVNNALVDNGNVTPQERAKIERIIIDGTGGMFLADDGTYKFIPSGTTNYDDLNGKPSINSVELDGNKTASQLGFSSVSTTGSYNDLLDKPIEITMLSELINDTGFITNTVGNLLNYYLKSETYNKTETNNLISNLSSIDVQIVETLPTTGISTSTIYLIKIGTTTNYDQWMYIDNVWANIGSTVIDLSNYYNKTEVDTLLNNKVDKIAGRGLSQENYTTTEKTKLSGLNNYTLPTATPSVLGGVKPDNSTTFVDVNGVLSAVGGASGVIDDAVTSLSKTWSSTKISEDISAVGEIANDISIAQKTINTRGTKELLNSKMTFTGNPPSVNGNASVTIFSIDVPLNDSIEKFNMLNFDVSLDSDTEKYYSKGNIVSTKNIVYNNTNTPLSNNNSLISLSFNLFTSDTSAYGYAHFVLRGWFKTSSLFHIDAIGLPVNDIKYNKVSIISILGINVENVTIDPVEYINTTQGIEDSPVGHILSQMGLVAPKHYLICDGTIYNIIDYPYLSQYIKDQFGTFNYFGGNGTTTFSVPDLRNEFLRGYHGTKAEQLSGEIGAHQSATNLLNTAIYRSGSTGQFLPYYSNSNGASLNTNIDSITLSALGRLAINGTLDTSALGSTSTFTSRPTNTAVLYCIKYEPTYFMKVSGLVEKKVLWEGSVGNSSATNANNSIDLSDSFMNYDMLGVCFGYSNAPGTYRSMYREIPPIEIKKMIDSTASNYNVTFGWGYGSTTDYTDIIKTSTLTRFNLTQAMSFITKVTGYKYKTNQSTDETYTDVKITDMVEGVYYGN